MSVQEIYAIALRSDTEDVSRHFDVAERLAAVARLPLRWAATRTSGPVDNGPVVVEFPTRIEACEVLSVAGEAMAVARWDAENADPAWLSFAGRDDGRIYRMELTRNAAPFTTLSDDPGHPHFALGPELARGWALALVVIRDHMPREELVRQLAEAAGVPIAAVSHPRK